MRYLNPLGQAVADLSYTYDRANNRTSETRNTDGTSDAYTYDSAYRLTNAQYNLVGGVPEGLFKNLAETFMFDGVNNRLAVTDTLPAVVKKTGEHKTSTDLYTPNSTNEYTSVGGVTQNHDANGNLTFDGKFTYAYDFRNLIVAMKNTVTGRLIQYRYDALGRRIEKTWGPSGSDPGDDADDPDDDEFTGSTVTRRYVFDGARVLEERNANNVEIREFVYGVGLDEPVRMTLHPWQRTAQSYYYCQSSNGNVLALTDASGTVVERYKYAAFGKEEVENPDGSKRSGSVCGNPIRWQGIWRDSAEGSPLYYFRSRMYDPTTGRFVNRDPIGVWGDRDQLGNGYSAFGGNPLNRRDPFGTADKPSEWTIVNLWNDSVKPVLQGVGALLTDSGARSEFAQGVSDVYTKGNAVQQSFNNEQQHLENAANLFYQEGQSSTDVAKNTTAVLLADATGSSNIYQASTGTNLTTFVATGDMLVPLTTEQRLMSGISGVTQLTSAVILVAPAVDATVNATTNALTSTSTWSVNGWTLDTGPFWGRTPSPYLDFTNGNPAQFGVVQYPPGPGPNVAISSYEGGFYTSHADLGNAAFPGQDVAGFIIQDGEVMVPPRTSAGTCPARPADVQAAVQNSGALGK